MKELEDLTDCKSRMDAKIIPYFGPMLLDSWNDFGLKFDRARWAISDLETRYKALLDKEKGRK